MILTGALLISACDTQHRSTAIGPHSDRPIGIEEVSTAALVTARNHLPKVRSANLVTDGQGRTFYEIKGVADAQNKVVYVTDTGKLVGFEPAEDR